MSKTSDDFWLSDEERAAIEEQIKSSPRKRAFELCLQHMQTDPVKAYQYFREASDDGIFHGYDIFPCSLFPKEEIPLFHEEILTIKADGAGLAIETEPMDVFASGWRCGTLQFDPVRIPPENLQSSPVFLLLPVESSYYDADIMGEVLFKAQMGVLLEKTEDGWRFIPSVPTEKEKKRFADFFRSEIEGFVRMEVHRRICWDKGPGRMLAEMIDRDIEMDLLTDRWQEDTERWHNYVLEHLEEL